MGSQTKLAMALHDQINVDLAGLKSDQVKSVLDFQIASSLAYALPLPSSSALSDIDLGKQWEVKHARPIAKFLDDINREFVIDYATIIRMSQAIWTFRYRLAYDPCYLHASLTRALCAANIIPGDVVETLKDIGSLDSSGISQLHATENGMSVIESKRRMIEKSFKDQYGMSTSFAGLEDNSDSLPGMLRRSKMSSLAAALESLDRDNLSGGEYDAMMGRLNGELDRQISKEARIDGIRSQIVKHGKVSRNVVAALESLEPGIITKHPKASRIRYTNSESDVGVVAALEAINWAKVGKWGLIGAIVSFMVALVAKCVSYIRRGVVAARAIEGQDLTKEEQDEYMRRVAELTSSGLSTSTSINSAIMELNSRRLSEWMTNPIKTETVTMSPKEPDELDIAMDEALTHSKAAMRESQSKMNNSVDKMKDKLKELKPAAEAAAKASVSDSMKTIGSDMAKGMNVSPVPPTSTAEKENALDKKLEGSIGKSVTDKVSVFAPDTKLSLERLLKSMYQDPSKVDFNQFMADLKKMEDAKYGEMEILKVLASSGKAGANMHKYPFVYGDLGANRIELANGAFYFATQSIQELRDELADAEERGIFAIESFVNSLKSIDKDGNFSSALSQLNMRDIRGVTSTNLVELLGKVGSDLTTYSESIKKDADSFKSKSISYSRTMRKDAEFLEKLINQGAERASVDKVDLSKSISILSNFEEEAVKAKDTERQKSIANTRATVTGVVSALKAIEVAAVSMLMFATDGIREYNKDMAYLANVAAAVAEFTVLVRRDEAYAKEVS